mmetsp:Transcript_15613/g.17352  ORF Transcript_15613/g.17352 Transcript_15613/m.17352 type:complete len:357 (+) Transcript_15613:12-1082(+)
MNDGRRASPKEQIVKLNIGGVKFVTTSSTLTKSGQNFFTSLLSGRFSPLKDEEGYIFIDRNGKYFSPLLDFLRTSKYGYLEDIPPERLKEEMEFYSISIPSKRSHMESAVMSGLENGLFVSCSSTPWFRVIHFGQESGVALGIHKLNHMKPQKFKFDRLGSRVTVYMGESKEYWFVHGEELVTNSPLPTFLFHKLCPVSPGTLFCCDANTVGIAIISKSQEKLQLHGFRFCNEDEHKGKITPRCNMYCYFRDDTKRGKSGWTKCTYEWVCVDGLRVIEMHCLYEREIKKEDKKDAKPLQFSICVHIFLLEGFLLARKVEASDTSETTQHLPPSHLFKFYRYGDHDKKKRLQVRGKK